MAEAAASSAASVAGRPGQSVRQTADAAPFPVPDPPERERDGTAPDPFPAPDDRADRGGSATPTASDEAGGGSAADRAEVDSSPENRAREVLGRARAWITGTVAFLAQKMGQEAAAASDRLSLREAEGIRAYLSAVARAPENSSSDDGNMTVVSPDGPARRVNMVV